jgi:hypothetical protein
LREIFRSVVVGVPRQVGANERPGQIIRSWTGHPDDLKYILIVSAADQNHDYVVRAGSHVARSLPQGTLVNSNESDLERNLYLLSISNCYILITVHRRLGSPKSDEGMARGAVRLVCTSRTSRCALPSSCLRLFHSSQYHKSTCSHSVVTRKQERRHHRTTRP